MRGAGVYVLGLLAGSFALTMTGAARANSPAPFSRPTGVMPGVLIERPSPVVVEREQLDIDCSAGTSPVHPVCSFQATYYLSNPTAQEEELLGAFYTADRAPSYHREAPVAPVRIALDGSNAQTEATDEQLARMDEIVRANADVAAIVAEKKLEFHRSPFRIVVAPGAKAKLVFDGTLEAFDYEDNGDRHGWVFPAILVRHPFIGPHSNDEWDEGSDEFLYLVSPLATWAGDPDVTVRIKHRSAVDFSSKTHRFHQDKSGGIVTESTTIRAKSGQNLRYELERDPSPFRNGGPIIGIGPRIGRAELHTRFGYEVGIARNYILGLNADTNFDNYITPALTIDAATPNFVFLIPALSFGAGAAAQFRKDAVTRVGVRTQFGITWPLVSLTFPIDIYPVANSSKSHVEGAFLTQLSF